MLKKFGFIAFFFIFFSLFADADLLYLGSGINNVRRKHSRSMEFRAEYKFHQKLKVIKPIVGASITTNTQTYIYGGFCLDFLPKSFLAISPSFAAGYYNKGNGKDLGFPLEFRTGIEIAAVLKNFTRVGVHFSHTSNASLGHKNPGLETLVFFIAIPFKCAK